MTMTQAEKIAQIMSKANRTSNEVSAYLSTGIPPLDKVISGKYKGGGIPVGQIIEVFGESQTGKTFLAVNFLIEAQRQGGCALFVDWERRIRLDFACNRGLNIDEPFFEYRSPDTWEEGNAQAIYFAKKIRQEKLIPDDKPIVIVLDSIASAIPHSLDEKSGDSEKEMVEAMAGNMRDHLALAKATGNTLKFVARDAKKYNATFVYINQVREDPTSKYASVVTPGGKAMSFYADCRIFLRRSIEKDNEKSPYGQIVKARMEKNSHTAPFGEVSFTIRYNDGEATLEKEVSLVEYMIDIGLIESPSKGWYVWGDKKVRKNDIIEAAQQDPAVYQSMVESLYALES